MYRFQSVVRQYLPKSVPTSEITFPYVEQHLVKIKWLLDKQSEVFRRQNHPTLDNAFEDLLHNIKRKNQK